MIDAIIQKMSRITSVKSIKAISQGISGEVYLVEGESENVIFKTSFLPNSQWRIQKEAFFLKQLSDFGTPRLIHHNPPCSDFINGFIIESYFPGSPLRCESNLSKNVFFHIGTKLNNFHSRIYSESGFLNENGMISFDPTIKHGFSGPFETTHEYFMRQISCWIERYRFKNSQFLPELETIYSNISAMQGIFEENFSVRLHGDLNVQNVLYCPTKGASFIDLEYMKAGGRAFDIHTFGISCFESGIEYSMIKAFLEGYGDIENLKQSALFMSYWNGFQSVAAIRPTLLKVHPDEHDIIKNKLKGKLEKLAEGNIPYVDLF